MTLRFTCPKCGRGLSAPEDCAGRSSKCRGCGENVVIPTLRNDTENHGQQMRRPKPNRAKNLANEARELAEEGCYSKALLLIERAIRLDQINGINEYYGLRAHVSKKLGKHEPGSALGFYDQAIRWAKIGRYLDAKIAYLEASTLDSFFLWSANNYAWLMATCKEPSARDGPEAVKVAWWVCEESQWNFWAFIGTLAAACASARDFPKAVEWQTAVLDLVPSDHRMEAVVQLRHFQAGDALSDGGTVVAGGEPDSRQVCDSEDQAVAEAKKQTQLLRTLALQGLFQMILKK